MYPIIIAHHLPKVISYRFSHQPWPTNQSKVARPKFHPFRCAASKQSLPNPNECRKNQPNKHTHTYPSSSSQRSISPPKRFNYIGISDERVPRREYRTNSELCIAWSNIPRAAKECDRFNFWSDGWMEGKMIWYESLGWGLRVRNIEAEQRNDGGNLVGRLRFKLWILRAMRLRRI